MGLAYEVMLSAQRALSDPTFANNPQVWKRLQKWASDAFDGIVALHAPMSPLTWETNTLLLGSQQQSNRQTFRFPWPVEIIGFLPSIIIPPQESEAIVPGVDDIRVQIDIDSQNYMTSGDGLSTPAGGSVGNFVTLAAMSVITPRLVGYKLRTATPDIGFTYQWKQPVGVYQDAFISMAMFARRIAIGA